MTIYFRSSLYFLIFILLQACASGGIAPVSNRDEIKDTPPNISKPGKKIEKKESKKRVNTPKKIVKNKKDCHVVAKGDTLYSIAWRYNYDYRQLANWNDIDAPYVIYLGNSICFKLNKGKSVKKIKSQPDEDEDLGKEQIQQNQVAQVNPNVGDKKSGKKLSPGKIKWFWPTRGKIVKSDSPTSKKGVDISGSSGQPVKAAAEGKIVYSGSGLVGYGKLIIIKHNDKFLSAYAYNSDLLVNEGDIVKAGQKISEMGQDQSGRNILHFEIRLNGNPINPLKYLPKNQG
ncbi:MAG TPA: peptidase M23 [Gammaproteobacteria bacterium]|nr:peptidase M23 [Gammaproteobacteria bacterium]